jgi:hypothetical protein
MRVDHGSERIYPEYKRFEHNISYIPPEFELYREVQKNLGFVKDQPYV